MDKSSITDTIGALSNQTAIKNAIYRISILLLAALIGLAFLIARSSKIAEGGVLIGGLIPIGAAIELNRRNKPQLSGTLIAVTLSLIVTIVATIGEGIYDIGVMAYPAILITAALILQRKITAYLTIFILLCIGWLILGDVFGFYQPVYPYQSLTSDFIIATVILVITAIAVQFLADTITNNLRRIQHELEERKKVERALREAEELYRNIVENTSVITYRDTAEVSSNTLYISSQIKAVLGYSQSEWQNTPVFWETICHPDDLLTVREGMRHLLERRVGKDVSEYRLQSKDGRWIWFHDESVLVMDDEGVPRFIHGVMTDITERRSAEMKVLQREAVLSAVAATAQRLLRATDWRQEINSILQVLGEATGASHVYLFENHQRVGEDTLSSMTYEYTATGMESELHSLAYQNIRLKPALPGLEDWYANLTAGKPFYGSRGQYPLYWKQAFEAQGLKTLLDVPIHVQDEFWGIIGFDHYLEEMPWSQAEIDALNAAAGSLSAAITRQRADEALRASEEKFQLAFHRTFVPMVISRADSQVILDVNEAFCKGIGYTREETVGRSALDLNIWRNRADQLRHQEVLATQGFDEEFKAEFRRKSGEIGVALISAITISLNNTPCLLHTVYDISKIEELLRELQAKNEELQSFTYTVSHDLRAPLITISGFLGYLHQDAVSGNAERVLRDITRISDAVRKMERLLNELLELSRIGRLMNPPQDVPFGEIVAEALQAVQGRVESTKVVVRVQGEFPIVHGDRVRLVEVVQNLVDNAAKFMGTQETPQIQIGVDYTDGKPVFFVRDNGIGIEPEYQDKIFGLFNKLDANSEGTGIGLALVKRIVEVHGGRIWVESLGRNHGTTFYFTLADGRQGEP